LGWLYIDSSEWMIGFLYLSFKGLVLERRVNKSLDSIVVNQFVLEARLLHFATEGVRSASRLLEDRVSSDSIILFIVDVW